MDFTITDEQKNLLAQLDAFCAEHLDEERIKRWIFEGNVPDSFTLAYVNEDFGRVGLPKVMNGIPASNVTCVLMLERLAFHAGATLPIQPLMTYTHLISSIAGAKQVNLLRDITATTGKIPFSLAVSEPQTGSDAYDIRTIAVEDGDGFTINGTKAFISLGQYAPYVVLIAHDANLEAASGKEALTFFLVPRDSAGLDTFPLSKVGQRLIPMADILLDNVRVGADAVIGERGQGAQNLLRSFEFSRTYVCATTVGLAEAALDEALSYARNRIIRNESILSFQQVQEMIVDMQIKVDAMKTLLYKTACDLDGSGADTRMTTAMLKRFVPKTAMEVADSAMQIMGGIGYLTRSRTARIWEECRGNRIQMGTDEVMTAIAAKRIVKRAAEEEKNAPVWRL